MPPFPVSPSRHRQQPRLYGGTLQQPGFGHIPPSVGKIVTHWADGSLSWCTGSVACAPNKNLIVTASHCVFADSKPERQKYPSAAEFYPRYESAQPGPHGNLDLKQTVGQKSYETEHKQGNSVHDQGIIEMHPQDGRNLADVVGCKAIEWASPS